MSPIILISAFFAVLVFSFGLGYELGYEHGYKDGIKHGSNKL